MAGSEEINNLTGIGFNTDALQGVRRSRQSARRVPDIAFNTAALQDPRVIKREEIVSPPTFRKDATKEQIRKGEVPLIKPTK